MQPVRRKATRLARAAPVRVAMVRVALALAVGGAAAWWCSPAAATPARERALAAGDYLEDDGAALRWPGAARDYAGRWWLDSGRLEPVDGWNPPDTPETNGPSAGLLWQPGGGGPWIAGFAIHARTADGDHVGLHRDLPGTGFTWLLGRRLGAVDATATWRSANGGLSSDADEPDEFEHRRDDVGLGLRFTLSPRVYVDLAGDRRHQRNRVQAAADPPPWDTGELSSGRSWSARARAFIALGDILVLTPVVEYLTEDFSGPVVGNTWYPDAAFANKGHLRRLGLALCRMPDPDRLSAITLEYLDLDGHHETLPDVDEHPAIDDDLSVLALRLAVERRVNWWLSLRASVSLGRTWDHAAPGDPGGDSDGDTSVQVDPAGGATIHLGAWGADLAAGSAPLPEPWRWIEGDPEAVFWLRATLHHDF